MRALESALNDPLLAKLILSSTLPLADQELKLP